jgi:hypothetical protein
MHEHPFAYAAVRYVLQVPAAEDRNRLGINSRARQNIVYRVEEGPCVGNAVIKRDDRVIARNYRLPKRRVVERRFERVSNRCTEILLRDARRPVPPAGDTVITHIEWESLILKRDLDLHTVLLVSGIKFDR